MDDHANKPSSGLHSAEGNLFGAIFEFHNKVMALLRAARLDDEKLDIAAERIKSLMAKVTEDIKATRDLNVQPRLHQPNRCGAGDFVWPPTIRRQHLPGHLHRQSVSAGRERWAFGVARVRCSGPVLPIPVEREQMSALLYPPWAVLGLTEADVRRRVGLSVAGDFLKWTQAA
jgi:hypothetical protein